MRTPDSSTLAAASQSMQKSQPLGACCYSYARQGKRKLHTRQTYSVHGSCIKCSSPLSGSPHRRSKRCASCTPDTSTVCMAVAQNAAFQCLVHLTGAARDAQAAHQTNLHSVRLLHKLQLFSVWYASQALQEMRKLHTKQIYCVCMK